MPWCAVKPAYGNANFETVSAIVFYRLFATKVINERNLIPESKIILFILVLAKTSAHIVRLCGVETNGHFLLGWPWLRTWVSKTRVIKTAALFTRHVFRLRKCADAVWRHRPSGKRLYSPLYPDSRAQDPCSLVATPPPPQAFPCICDRAYSDVPTGGIEIRGSFQFMFLGHSLCQQVGDSGENGRSRSDEPIDC